MNQQELKGNWLQLRGKIQKEWGRLTNDDIEQIKGSGDSLIGKLVERYGMAKNEAQEKLNKFLESIDVATDDTEGTFSKIAKTAEAGKNKLAEASEAGKKKLIEAGETISEQASSATEAVTNYVKEKPFVGLGIAALAGLIIGALMQR